MRARLSFLLCCAPLVMGVVACDDTPTAPSPPFELTLSPATLPAGAAAQGSVTLRGPVAHEFHLQLSSSDAVASVPASIVVPPGTGSVAFTVTTRLVAADTVARITATAGNAMQVATLQVLSPVARPPTLDSLELDAMVVRGGQSAQATVRLSGAAPTPGGLTVSIRSSNAVAVVPATVAVPGGAASSTFTITTRPVTLETQLEISALYADQTRSAPLRVTP